MVPTKRGRHGLFKFECNWVNYRRDPVTVHCSHPDSKVHEGYMGPTWGRQDPGGPHVGPMNLAIRAEL